MFRIIWREKAVFYVRYYPEEKKKRVGLDVEAYMVWPKINGHIKEVVSTRKKCKEVYFLYLFECNAYLDAILRQFRFVLYKVDISPSAKQLPSLSFAFTWHPVSILY